MPLDRAAVALDAVLEPDHGQLPFQQVSARARVLTAALAPQRYVVVVGAVVDRGQAGAAPDGAVILQPRAVFGVGHVRVDVVLPVGALGPGLPALGGVALHLKVAVAVLVPLAGVGVFLEHPDKVLPVVRAAGAHHVQRVDELAGIDGMGAIGVFLSCHLHTPELRQMCKVVSLRLGLGGGLTDKSHAVVGQLAGGDLTGRKQRQLDAVDPVVVQDVAKPPGQHIVVGALPLHPLTVPPVHKELIQLGLGSAFIGQQVIDGVDLGRVGGHAGRALGAADVRPLHRGHPGLAGRPAEIPGPVYAGGIIAAVLAICTRLAVFTVLARHTISAVLAFGDAKIKPRRTGRARIGNSSLLAGVQSGHLPHLDGGGRTSLARVAVPAVLAPRDADLQHGCLLGAGVFDSCGLAGLQGYDLAYLDGSSRTVLTILAGRAGAAVYAIFARCALRTRITGFALFGQLHPAFGVGAGLYPLHRLQGHPGAAPVADGVQPLILRPGGVGPFGRHRDFAQDCLRH